jgi:hypothetical protein
VKINNYLNIWRIAVSSDAALPCPLKPAEMQIRAKRDAASTTKVKESRQEQKFPRRKNAAEKRKYIAPLTRSMQVSNQQPVYLPPTNQGQVGSGIAWKFRSSSSPPVRLPGDENLPRALKYVSAGVYRVSSRRFLLLQAAEN